VIRTTTTTTTPVSPGVKQRQLPQRQLQLQTQIQGYNTMVDRLLIWLEDIEAENEKRNNRSNHMIENSEVNRKKKAERLNQKIQSGDFYLTINRIRIQLMNLNVQAAPLQAHDDEIIYVLRQLFGWYGDRYNDDWGLIDYIFLPVIFSVVNSFYIGNKKFLFENKQIIDVFNFRINHFNKEFLHKLEEKKELNVAEKGKVLSLIHALMEDVNNTNEDFKNNPEKKPNRMVLLGSNRKINYQKGVVRLLNFERDFFPKHLVFLLGILASYCTFLNSTFKITEFLAMPKRQFIKKVNIIITQLTKGIDTLEKKQKDSKKKEKKSNNSVVFPQEKMVAHIPQEKMVAHIPQEKMVAQVSHQQLEVNSSHLSDLKQHCEIEWNDEIPEQVLNYINSLSSQVSISELIKYLINYHNENE